MQNKKNFIFLGFALIAFGLFLYLFFLNNKPRNATQPLELAGVSENTIPSKTTETIKNSDVTPTPSPENKLCDWIDKSDIIIELLFADGVTKDTSYEAGFYYSSIGSDMRLARGACNYRTGFSYDEMKNAGTTQIGVRGFSDSNRRQLENEPITVVFDENGKPSLPSPIIVKVLN